MSGSESFSELSQFFYELSEEERVKLLAGEGLFEKRRIPKGTVIFSEGDLNNELYLIQKGNVEISKKTGPHSGRRKILAHLARGTIFGEGALLSGRPRSATAKALSDLEVLVLTKKKFDTFVEESPREAIHLLMSLIRVVNQRLIWSSHELVTLYDVMEKVGEHWDDMNAFFDHIEVRLSSVTKSTAGLIALRNVSSGAFDVVAEWGRLKKTPSEFEEIAHQLADVPSYFLDHQFIVSIRDLSGKYLGFMIMKKDEPWTMDERKISLAIADQIAIALANYEHFESERDREKLGQKPIEF